MRQLALLLALSLVSAWADLSTEQILRKAAYLHEFEGKSSEASSLLTKLIETGRPQERARASLYLGKIAESAGDTKSAVYYYRQVLEQSDAGLDLHYWVSERLDRIDPRPRQLVASQARLPQKIRRMFDGDPLAVLLEDGSMALLDGKGNFLPSRIRIPAGHELLSFGARGAVSLSPNRRSILLLPLDTSIAPVNLALDGPLSGFLNIGDSRWLLSTPKTLTLRDGDRFLWRVENPWRECSPGAVLRNGRTLAFVCPDNTIQLLRTEDGSPFSQLATPYAIESILPIGDGLLAISFGDVWFFRPQRSLSPVWQASFRGITQTIALGETAVAIKTSEGLIHILDSESGAKRGQIEAGQGKMHKVDRFLAHASQEGEVSLWDAKAQRVWTWQGDGAPGAGLAVSQNYLVAGFTDGRIVAFDRKNYGIQKNELQLLEMRALEAKSQGEWKDAHQIADSLIAKEPGNTTGWTLRAQHYDLLGKKDSALLAWGMAAIHGRNDGGSTIALRAYARELGAEWVSSLGFQQTGVYPMLLSAERNIFHLDPSGQGLVSIDAATGARRWRSQGIRLGNDFITASDSRSLVIASGLQLQLLQWADKGRSPISIELPGKAFQVMLTNTRVLVSTWNGYVLSLAREGLQASWSRKPSSSASWIAELDQSIYIWSMDGRLQKLDAVKGELLSTISTEIADPAGLYAMQGNLLLVNRDGMLQMQSTQDSVLWRRELPAQIFHVQPASNSGRLLLGLANQQVISLDPKDGALQWSWTGKGSTFVHPALVGNVVFVDQGRSVAILDATKGKLLNSRRLPEECGPVLGLANSAVVALRSGLILSFGPP